MDERVIVPRSYLGEMLAGPRADELFGPDEGLLTPEPERVTRILDLCTGSGCLAILAAMRFPGAIVDAVDLSADALAVARRNVEEHGLADRVHLIEGDLYGPLRAGATTSSSPTRLCRRGGRGRLPARVRGRAAPRPRGGDDGLDLVRRIVEGAPAHLAEGGGLLCEIGEDRHIVETDFPLHPFLWLDSEQSEGEVFWIAADGYPPNG